MDILGYSSLEDLSKDLGINRGNLHRIFMLQNSPGLEFLPILCRTLLCPAVEMLHVLNVVDHNYLAASKYKK